VSVSVDADIITVTSTPDANGVCPSADCTLREAIRVAADGDTIDFSLPANSAITLTSGLLFIAKNLTIRGPGANLLTVQRGASAGNFPIFGIAAFGQTNTISGLTIANGSSSSGGAFSLQSSNCGAGCFVTLNIIDSTLFGNAANFGGALSAGSNNMVNITNSNISGNSTPNDSNLHGGAVFLDSGSVVNIANSTLFGNSSYDGGGVYIKAGGTVNATNTTISGNSAVANGGGIDNVSGTLNAKNTIIAQNTAPTGSDVAGTLTSQGYNFIGEIPNGFAPTTGDQFGSPGFPADPKLGPLQDNGGPTKTQALLSDSTAIDRGNSSGFNIDQRGFVRPVDTPSLPNASGGDGSDIGAYEVQADVLRGCNIINQIVKNNNDQATDSLRDVIANVCAGSTITFAPNVTGAINLTSAELLVNKAVTINGPGANLLSVQRDASAGNFRIFNINGNFKVAISGLTIANGNVSFGNFGGGIFNQGGLLTLTSCAVSGNTADFGGGGISNTGTLTLINSTVSGNTVRLGGGGISGGTVNVTNSTISGNKATGGNAGGIAVDRVTLFDSTVTGNSASGSGGGIYNNSSNGASVSSANTIIALNTAASAPDVYGAFTSDGFNLIGDNSGSTITPPQPSDKIGVTAAQLNIGPLQDNGGPSKTHALRSGSFAIDKGKSSSSTDQRGLARPFDLADVANATDGDGSDIGAFEFDFQPLRITSIARLANGHVVLQCLGLPNQVNDLQVSPDLKPGTFMTISPLPGAASNTGAFQYDDANAAGLTKRFYRLVLP
jgi:CSLREA domain-containing protein